MSKEKKNKINVKESSLTNIKQYILAEELMNAISHGIGFLLAIAGTVVGIVFAAKTGRPIAVVSMAVYGTTLMLLYLVSTLYHSLTNPKAKRVFKVLDHASIFVLIAGCYTPPMLVGFGGALGWSYFGIIWGLAIVAVTLSSISLEKFKKINIILCLIMGWLIAFQIPRYIEVIGMKSMVFMLIGGIMYSIGVIPYKLKKYRFTHALWHLFVLAGSIFQYFAILEILK